MSNLSVHKGSNVAMPAEVTDPHPQTGQGVSPVAIHAEGVPLASQQLSTQPEGTTLVQRRVMVDNAAVKDKVASMEFYGFMTHVRGDARRARLLQSVGAAIKSFDSALLVETPGRLEGFQALQEAPRTCESSDHQEVAHTPEAMPAARLNEVENTIVMARDAGIDEIVLEQLLSERDRLRSEIHGSGSCTYQTHDIRINHAATARLERTIQMRAAKKQKIKASRIESRKALKAKCDKFLREFKSVFKNIGKLGKAIGDGARGILEAQVSGDTARLGGFDTSEAQMVLNQDRIHADALAGNLGEMAVVTGGIAGATQMVETAADIWFFYNKTEKLKVDEKTVQDFAESLAELSAAKKELAMLRAKLGPMDEAIQMAREENLEQGMIDTLETRRNELFDDMSDALDAAEMKVATLTQKVNDTAIDSKLSAADQAKFHHDLDLEIAKLYKSGGDGVKAVIDVSRLAMATGTAASEGLKAASGTVGAIVGPLTFVINTIEGTRDVGANRAALRLRRTASTAIKSKAIRQDDVELLAIAERIRLKQKKQSVDKGLSATKNAFGAASGLASGFAAAATIAAMATGAAVGVAAIATPIGWGLAGAAALAAIGYGAYKLARHIHSSGIKSALQNSLQILGRQEDPKVTLAEIRSGLTAKEVKRLDRVANKLSASLKAQGIIKTKGELTVEELQGYASKKLLARDTGIAVNSLYQRFKEEVAVAFMPKTTEEITAADMQNYLDGEKDLIEAGSAASLMNRLGLSLSADDALLLMNTGDKGESNALKFLGKKLRLI